jgi:hypothetical protein
MSKYYLAVEDVPMLTEGVLDHSICDGFLVFPSELGPATRTLLSELHRDETKSPTRPGSGRAAPRDARCIPQGGSRPERGDRPNTSSAELRGTSEEAAVPVACDCVMRRTAQTTRIKTNASTPRPISQAHQWAAPPSCMPSRSII